MKSKKQLQFIINQNTDTVDIREKCLGLTTRIERIGVIE